MSSWTSSWGVPWSSLGIVGACLAWAIDNNFTRKVSAGDPVQIAILKGLVSGSVNTVLALALSGKLPSASSLLAAGVVGFFGYGVSLTLFVLALWRIERRERARIFPPRRSWAQPSRFCSWATS